MHCTVVHLSVLNYTVLQFNVLYYITPKPSIYLVLCSGLPSLTLASPFFSEMIHMREGAVWNIMEEQWLYKQYHEGAVVI